MNLSKFTRSAVSVVTALGMSAFGLATSAYAGQLSNSKVTIADPTVAASTTYAIAFKPSVATAIRKVTLQFAVSASGSGAVPTGMTIGSTPVTAVTWNNTANTPFATSGNVTQGTAGTIVIDAGSGNAQTTTAGSTSEVDLTGVTNPTDSNSCDTVAGSESCYVRITTYDNALAIVDQSVATFTVVTAVTVTATVDPYMTFTVSGVTTGQATKDTALSAETGTAITSGVTGTQIPFSNISVGAAKYAMQGLSVRTNASLGYNIYHKFTSTGDVTLFGSASASNNFDTFTGTFSTPTAWVSPTGTAASVNSGWIGMRTNDSVSTGSGGPGGSAGAPFVGALNWAAPALLSNATGNIVKARSGPDNGQSDTTTYVTYKIEANAFEPADSYTGSMVYNVVATY